MSSFPPYRLEEAGAEVDVASLKKGNLRGKHGYVVEANLAFPEVQPDNYDLLLLPGGKAPQSIRDNLDAREIVKFFFLREPLTKSEVPGVHPCTAIVQSRK